MQTYSDVYVATECPQCYGRGVQTNGVRCWLCEGDGTIEVPEGHPWVGLGDVITFTDDPEAQDGNG